jgi:hypothetical protein
MVEDIKEAKEVKLPHNNTIGTRRRNRWTQWKIQETIH